MLVHHSASEAPRRRPCFGIQATPAAGNSCEKLTSLRSENRSVSAGPDRRTAKSACPGCQLTGRAEANPSRQLRDSITGLAITPAISDALAVKEPLVRLALLPSSVNVVQS